MKVLTIGTDRKIFEEGSVVRARVLEYAAKVKEYHVVVFTKNQNPNFKFQKIENLFLYPTNSASKLTYVFDAIKIGVGLGKDSDLVVSAQDPFESGLAAYKIAKKLGAPLQLQIHTDFLSPYFKNSLLNRLRVQIAKRIIKKAKGIRAVSSVIADSIRSAFPNLQAQVDVLPVFVDIRKIIDAAPQRNFKIEFPQFEKVILMVSRLTKEKRIDTGLEVFKKVLEQVPKTGLVIAGDGPEKENLMRLAEELGVSEKVVFLGWQTDLISFYKTADVFLLTSEFEGYGMSLVEAAAAGVPIVTTNVGLAKTPLFQDHTNVFICDVGDVRHISKHVFQLITDSAKHDLLRANMQASIREAAISKEEYIAKYFSLLKKLL